MKANKKPKVAIVIPAYNEAAVIGDVIKSVKQKIKKENFFCRSNSRRNYNLNRT